MIFHLRLATTCLAAVCLLGAGSSAFGVNVLLNSWESGELEGWEDSFGSNTDPNSLTVVAGTGNTDGNNALQFTVLQNNFEWSIERFVNPDDPQYADFVTALENPAFHEISYDITYDLTYSAPDEGSFFNIGLSLSVLEGATDVFHQGFGLFEVGSDAIINGGGNISGTASVGQNLSSFAPQPFQTDPAPGFIRPIIPVNGNWDAPATFTIDNFRITEASPPQDLDGDLDVDLDDFTEFMLWHKSDFTGLTSEVAAARGDLDGDFDSDFQDFIAFEVVFDQLNGPGAFARALSVPEPMSVLMVLAGAGLLATCRRRSALCVALIAAGTIGVQPASALTIDVLESWESGINGWTDAVGNGAQVPAGASLTTSAIGATDGTNSLAVTQNEDTFALDTIFNATYSYDAEVRYFPGAPQLDALNAAFDVGSSNYELHVDVTYDSGSIPSGSNVKVGIGLEGSGAGFNTVENLASVTTPGSGETSVTIVEPLSSWDLPQQGNSTFFDISFGLNSDWGGGPATVHFDNLRLVQVSEPAILTLEVDRETGAVRILNPSASTSVEFDYYEIVSGGGLSLDATNWLSLDANLDSDEGWIAAGGAGTGDLTEANLSGSSTLGASADFLLGDAFAVGASEDLTFQYREPDRPGALRTGNVVYIGEVSNFPGDANGDGTVDLLDLDILGTNFGASGVGFAGGDFNTDGTVDLLDLDILGSNFGMSAGATSIPEPATCLSALFALGAAMASGRRTAC